MPNVTILSAGLSPSWVGVICVIAIVIFTGIILVVSRYKKCPSDKIMVIYGNVGTNKDGTSRSAKCIHGGASFIVPVVQAYEYLDLTPLSISVDLKSEIGRAQV